MTNLKTMMTKVMLGAMTVTTLLATSAGASAATTTTPAPAVAQPTVTLKKQAQPEIRPTTIKLHKHVTTTQISSQVQTAVDASALNLDQQHHDGQLK
ncbi:hypothetical protein [Levilactobacillus suantsaiihabitans]|uniref:Uncharacterized protein n=1 Tax=Levilactobacillus suantsaiihabitans TaxID=2487722 RepID=A0A4Z0JBY8_9LACO|nr:hypothetical protein [Levilactobacillus suantsaiihabitans]TGD19847.1 hypothetical protein EGT51_03140 [Levilactobacillus suantsaiihabitans]